MSFNITNWLRKNAVLASSAVYGGNQIEIYQHNKLMWLITPEKQSELNILMIDDNTHGMAGHNGKFPYMTSEGGLIITAPKLPDGATFVYRGLNVLRTEYDRGMWVTAQSTYANQWRNIDSSVFMEQEAKFVAKDDETKARELAFKTNIKNLLDRLNAKSSDPEYLKLVEQAMSFDHSYDYIDNLVMWRNADDLRKKLEAGFDACGFDGKAIMQDVISSHMSY